MEKEKKKRNRKGFTLIELLAVIVILGLLMAIAIPSVTKYITQSRKKTVTSTIGNYISAVVTDVNDMEYKFTGSDTVYALPIECIAVERGGTSPLGLWLHANDDYWAYILVQYDDDNSKYVYGFTFKDSNGNGMYPTVQSKIDSKGKDIKTKLNISKPANGKVTSITEVGNWNGFDVESDTDLVVLESLSEGKVGNGETTCTLKQKGNNYEEVEQEKNNGGSNNNQSNENSLANLIKKNNKIIPAAPTLTTSSNNTSDASGLYSSTNTNSGDPTYYFRGNVQNNNVSFAGLDWKIIRINEDGTVRLILDGIVAPPFSWGWDTYDKMYYSNGSNAKTQVESWYKTNIEGKGYDSYVATGTFCEQAKVKYSSSLTSGGATMAVYTAYTPNFECITDGNDNGVLNSKVGLITYDEVLHAGGYIDEHNSNYYLYNEGYSFWTMSPGGFDSYGAREWLVNIYGAVRNDYVDSSIARGNRPVINLNADVLATINDSSQTPGTSANPYIVQTN